MPVAEADAPEGHAVRAMYLAAGASDVAIEDAQAAARLEDALERQWDTMVESKQYLTGGLGSRWDGEAFGDPFELPPDVAYAETCASIGAIQWAWRRLLHTGQASYADAIEKILLNGFVSGVSLSGEEFFYVNALQVREGAVAHDHRHPVNGRQKWFQVACCPPNVMRTISQLAGYLATTRDGSLTLQQYATSTIQHRGHELRVETDYPWDGHVAVEVGRVADRDADDEWTLALRVPGWCDDATLIAPDGVTSHPTPGYVEVTRRWQSGRPGRAGPCDAGAADPTAPPRRRGTRLSRDRARTAGLRRGAGGPPRWHRRRRPAAAGGRPVGVRAAVATRPSRRVHGPHR